ncbi:MAG TPA: NADH-quinone oxidoreductase subunit L [Gammaproteobacteria bacterium]|nr:NADH-quinone oxidoreductase subunit L [Gammaproteobacteria bacterium]
MESVFLIIVLAPLAAALVAGLGMRYISRDMAHWVTILGVGLSFLLSAWVLWSMLTGSMGDTNVTAYDWGLSDGVRFQVGFLVDRLTALMITVVTFVSLMVHVYTIGYMQDDPGYKRFFSYISLFTFSMLMLVMANNFLQLFFGWEAVGLVSYLLIGFWYTRPTAIYANLKAFLVNRVGDFGFLLGIALILSYTGSLDYADVFGKASQLSGQTIALLPASWGAYAWSVPTVICILLFVGAMGKSAQVPLHVWLPDSMEGPTPISALIHAATMVTAGIFMVARMSPLFELSDTALSVVLVIGATTAFFMGLVGVVHNDIKRVVAYSTLSQLGYMAVALGASAYSAGIFHLMTHAFFKALLFLAAGSVIIAMHHEQDMRYMGGLRKYLPITYATCVIGSLALIAFPGFSGFFSKDTIIEAVHASTRTGASYAYWCVLLGAFVTGLYSFRMLFMTFHGKERFVVEKGHGPSHADQEHKPGHLTHAPHESPWVVTVPLILLAIPSVLIGWLTAWPVLFGGYFGDAIKVAPQNDVLGRVAEEFRNSGHAVLMSYESPALWLALAGAATAWFFYLQRPDLPGKVARYLRPLYALVANKFYFDELYVLVFSKGTRALGRFLWQAGDVTAIDGLVNGAARGANWLAGVLRRGQSGYLYHYAFAMIIGLCMLLGWLILK